MGNINTPAKQEVAVKPCLQPRPNVLVSCRSPEGEDNALAVAYCCNCSFDPPMLMVGITPTRYSYKMVKDSGCFVVNLVEKSYKEIFDYLGSHSRRDEDKLAKMNVAVTEAETIDAPILADCPVNIECKIVGSIMTGSHEMFAATIERVHANSALIDKDGNIDFSKVELL